MTMEMVPTVEFVENIPDLPDKVLAVIRLKQADATNEEIAQVLSIPEGHVEEYVQRWLRRDLMRSTSQKKFARRLLIKKLEGLARGIATKAADPKHPEQLAAVGKLRELYRDVARLDGLDSPTEVTINTPDAVVIEAFVRKMAGLDEFPDEANILDAEVIEDEETEESED